MSAKIPYREGRPDRISAITIGADGRFVVEDLSPGQYVAEFAAGTPPSKSDRSAKEAPDDRVAWMLCGFEVSDDGDGGKDESLDLGDLPVKFRRFAVVGQEAPPLVFQTLDGKRAALSDYRGKFVMVEFGTVSAYYGRTFCELMAPVYDQFKNHDIFFMVHIQLGHSVEQARQYVRQSKGKVVELLMGSLGENLLILQWGFGGHNGVYFIDPQGTLLGANLGALGEIKPTVTAALAEYLSKNPARQPESVPVSRPAATAGNSSP